MDDKAKESTAQSELDPDLAELLDIEVPKPAPEPAHGEGGPDFRTLFGEERATQEAEKPPAEQVDTTRKSFPIIVKLEEEPKPFFQDKDYYKKVLAGEGEAGPRLHDLLGKFMKAEDPEEKSHFRAQLISAFWELGSAVAYRANREPDHPQEVVPPVWNPFTGVPLPLSTGTWSPGSSTGTPPESPSTTWMSGWR